MKNFELFSSVKEKILILKSKNKKAFYGVILGVFIVCLIVILIFPTTKTNTNENTSKSSNNTSISSYASGVEEKIENMLINIDSIKKVSAFVMIESSPTYTYLMDTEETTTKNGDSSTTMSSSSVVFEKDGSISKPIIVSTIMPKITGVLIVTNKINASTKLNIINSISIVLNIDVSCISILQES